MVSVCTAIGRPFSTFSSLLLLANDIINFLEKTLSVLLFHLLCNKGNRSDGASCVTIFASVHAIAGIPQPTPSYPGLAMKIPNISFPAISNFCMGRYTLTLLTMMVHFKEESELGPTTVHPMHSVPAITSPNPRSRPPQLTATHICLAQIGAFLWENYTHHHSGCATKRKRRGLRTTFWYNMPHSHPRHVVVLARCCHFSGAFREFLNDVSVAG
jgi:hypothetical protein